MKTTLNKIKSHSPCAEGWKKLLRHLGKIEADDEPLYIETILQSNGLDDALWCLRAVEGCEKEMRLLAVAFARQVQHLMTDPRSLAALDAAEGYANGTVTSDELAAAQADAVAAQAGAWADVAAAWAARARADAAAVADAAAQAAAQADAVAAQAGAWADVAAAWAAACEDMRMGQAKILTDVCRLVQHRNVGQWQGC